MPLPNACMMLRLKELLNVFRTNGQNPAEASWRCKYGPSLDRLWLGSCLFFLRKYGSLDSAQFSLDSGWILVGISSLEQWRVLILPILRNVHWTVF
jgi:hypothetical protein